ncbi:MAG: hypothetical protein WKG07_12735 [Hymenobacter sp.]
MSENSSEVNALQAAAEQVRQQLGLAAFNAGAVRELDHFIEAQRLELASPGGEREGVVAALGCFLGQCLVSAYKAKWAAGPDGSTGVGLANRLFSTRFIWLISSLIGARRPRWPSFSSRCRSGW